MRLGLRQVVGRGHGRHDIVLLFVVVVLNGRLLGVYFNLDVNLVLLVVGQGLEQGVQPQSLGGPGVGTLVLVRVGVVCWKHERALGVGGRG
jgi:hypothetical protein